MGRGPFISLSKAIRIFLISIFVVSGIPWIGFGVYKYLWHLRALDSKYEIVAIMQNCHSSESLKTAFIAELLDLAIDQTSNLYQFDLLSAHHKLKNFPLIKEVSIKRIPPGVLSIDYSLRQPIAFLGDVTNTAIDEEGYIFPFHPFFSPKNLPVIVLGQEIGDVKWGEKVRHPGVNLAFEVMDIIESLGLVNTNPHIQIDVASADAVSLGDQKIILEISESKKHHDILLDPLHFHLGLKRYKLLLNELFASNSAMIDLRLPKLGYIRRQYE